MVGDDYESMLASKLGDEEGGRRAVEIAACCG
jgi:hypothetical protein